MGLSFNHDFVADYDALMAAYRAREPFAFVRYGDGEYWIFHGHKGRNCDGWVYPGGKGAFSKRLTETLTCREPGYCLGLPGYVLTNSSRASLRWYRQTATVPANRMTFADLLYHSNWVRFQQEDLGDYALVSCKNGDFTVPETPFDFDWKPLVAELVKLDKPILVAAGPLAKIIIHEVWKQWRKAPIIDIGSALDLKRIHGRPTRHSQHPGHPKQQFIPTWETLP